MRTNSLNFMGRYFLASMRPWRSHGNELDLSTEAQLGWVLQCGRGGATEMRLRADTSRNLLVQLQCGRGGATEMSMSIAEGSAIARGFNAAVAEPRK